MSDEENKKDKISENMRYFNTLLDRTSELKNADIYYKFTYNIFNNIIEYQLGVETALARISYENSNNSIELEREGWVNNVIKRFSELMFIDGMVRMTGNMDKREKIIDSYIENYMFFKQEPNKQHPNKQQLKNLLDNLLKEESQR